MSTALISWGLSLTYVDEALDTLVRVRATYIEQRSDDVIGNDAGNLAYILLSEWRVIIAMQTRATLQERDRFAHVSFRRGKECADRLQQNNKNKDNTKSRDAIARKCSCTHFLFDVHVLRIRNLAKSRSQHVVSERLEPELGAARRDWFDDATHVVADETEARRLGVLFHRATQRRLRR